MRGEAEPSITGDVRRKQTRAPASAAGSAALCHSRQTLVIRLSPRLSDASVTTSSPWSPYQAIALPARYAGRRSLSAIAPASTRVVVTLLSRRLRAQVRECTLPMVGVPARLTTTSARSITSRS